MLSTSQTKAPSGSCNFTKRVAKPITRQPSAEALLTSESFEGELPSIGSEAYFDRPCKEGCSKGKRCAFFRKGRCSKGNDCTHCHFLHGDSGLRKEKDPPSIGSEGHFEGSCKQCSFLPKGPSNNGKDCTNGLFMHEEHAMAQTRTEYQERPHSRDKADLPSIGSEGHFEGSCMRSSYSPKGRRDSSKDRTHRPFAHEASLSSSRKSPKAAYPQENAIPENILCGLWLILCLVLVILCLKLSDLLTLVMGLHTENSLLTLIDYTKGLRAAASETILEAALLGLLLVISALSSRVTSCSFGAIGKRFRSCMVAAGCFFLLMSVVGI